MWCRGCPFFEDLDSEITARVEAQVWWQVETIFSWCTPPTPSQVLHVEQEVTGDDMTVLQCVLSADAERSRLVAEEASLLAQQKEREEKGEDKDAKAGEDPFSQRLAAIYKRMEEIDAHSAESRASSILAVSSPGLCSASTPLLGYCPQSCFEADATSY